MACTICGKNSEIKGDDGCDCPTYPDVQKEPKKGLTITLPGGVRFENGILCEVPDDWPLCILPSYKAPCSKCGNDCGCNNGGGTTDCDGLTVTCPDLPDLVKTDAGPVSYTSPVFDGVKSFNLSGLPTWLAIDSINTTDAGSSFSISGVPPYSNVEETTTFQINGSNAECDLQCSSSLTIVCPPNNPLTCPTNETLQCGENRQIAYTSQSLGPTGVSVEAINLPSYLSFIQSGTQAVLSGSMPDDLFSTSVIMRVSIGELVCTWTVTFECTVANGTNQPPIADCPGGVTATEGESFDQNFSGICTDPNGDVVTVVVSGLPSGMDWSQIANGGFRLFGTPTQAGSFGLTITCNDGTNSPTTCNMVLTVNANNLAVGVGCPRTVDGVAGASIPAAILSGFLGGTSPISITAVGLPSGVSILDFGDGNWGLQGTLPTAGTYPFDVAATDSSTPAQTVTCSGNEIVVAASAPQCPASGSLGCSSLPATISIPGATSANVSPSHPDYTFTFNAITEELEVTAVNPGLGGAQIFTVTASNGNVDQDCSFSINMSACVTSGTVQISDWQCNSDADGDQCDATGLSANVCGGTVSSLTFTRALSGGTTLSGGLSFTGTATPTSISIAGITLIGSNFWSLTASQADTIFAAVSDGSENVVFNC